MIFLKLPIFFTNFTTLGKEFQIRKPLSENLKLVNLDIDLGCAKFISENLVRYLSCIGIRYFENTVGAKLCLILKTKIIEK